MFTATPLGALDEACACVCGVTFETCRLEVEEDGVLAEDTILTNVVEGGVLGKV